MVSGKRDLKGKAPTRRVSIAPEEDDSSPPSPSPGPSTFSRKSAQGSSATSHVSFASQSRSHPECNCNHTATSSSSTSAPASVPASAPATTTAAQIPASCFSVLPNPVSQPYASYWGLAGHTQATYGVPFAATVNPFGTGLQQPPSAPARVNPPDELGPPPRPPPPPAIPPVINPLGVHFQPQVPSTEMGPMIHRYVPRQDPVGAAPGMLYTGQQMAGSMVNGVVTPMQGLPPGVVQTTAPINPVIVQQPGVAQVMIQNHAMRGGPKLILPGPIQAVQVNGNPPQIAGLQAHPPVHVEPALGVGLTPTETMAQNIRIAQNNKGYEPQDFKPADPDPYRMYWFRELNGHWAVFPRRQIDRLDARWYRTDDGVFYAVRLSE
ncbi:hypothetical protein MYCTH_2118259 [Thermothelomyces thermophilus ATCC 42464]|uniref:Uncharacterized protein n=1 Tax=Thermothelomyces thermophilus (strain ATCC 42464 / BCRC 31852 / DSM 1799) TaxID=573729 RepID=G2QEJ0_THET4|nr:uncharacterized protein MYCTH_2118259 [Thermothelomyces thermophilus ATCC 42464]AEO57773.1 hypothetical protein MYCTH_2118259 [Thermothelomyces thermophilus ATCC 42464]